MGRRTVEILRPTSPRTRTHPIRTSRRSTPRQRTSRSRTMSASSSVARSATSARSRSGDRSRRPIGRIVAPHALTVTPGRSIFMPTADASWPTTGIVPPPREQAAGASATAVTANRRQRDAVMGRAWYPRPRARATHADPRAAGAGLVHGTARQHVPRGGWVPAPARRVGAARGGSGARGPSHPGDAVRRRGGGAAPDRREPSPRRGPGRRAVGVSREIARAVGGTPELPRGLAGSRPRLRRDRAGSRPHRPTGARAWARGARRLARHRHVDRAKAARDGGAAGARNWTGLVDLDRRAPSRRSRQRPTLPHGDRAVPSALEGLTAVFGMGTGVSPLPSPPEIESNGISR